MYRQPTSIVTNPYGTIWFPIKKSLFVLNIPRIKFCGSRLNTTSEVLASQLDLYVNNTSNKVNTTIVPLSFFNNKDKKDIKYT